MSLAGVTGQYTQGDLLERVLAALRDAGKDLDNLQPQDLFPFDQFHSLGLEATTGLADAAQITAGEQVLDVGSGLGGPARVLTTKYRAEVTGIDLTPEFCEIAKELNSRVGLGDRIVIQEANALALPFDDDSFDVVWTQHVSMNIEDKPTLYDQFARVLKPQGRLAFFDIIAGEGEPIYPVPWADDASISHLADENTTRTLLSAANFRVSLWEDITGPAIDFFAHMVPGAAPSALGPHLIIPGIGPKMANLVRNMKEGRVRVIRAVCHRD